jgi:hypothetical protein
MCNHPPANLHPCPATDTRASWIAGALYRKPTQTKNESQDPTSASRRPRRYWSNDTRNHGGPDDGLPENEPARHAFHDDGRAHCRRLDDALYDRIVFAMAYALFFRTW